MILINDLKKIQSFSEKLVVETGEFLAKHQHRAKILRRKKLQDFLINLDIEAQEQIVTKIRRKFPNHGIIAEENDLKQIKEFTWTVDPIDGTKYYLKGLNIYSTSLSLFHNDEPLVGAIYQPASETLYSASKGNGAFLNNKIIQPSNISKLNESMIYATLPNISMSVKVFKKTLKKLELLFQNSYRVRYLADANIAMAWIAHGGFEAFINIPGDENIWDIGPGIALINASGGKVTDLNGKSIKHFNLAKGIIASNGKIHDQLVKLLS